MTFDSIYDEVKDILENYPETRYDDMLLYGVYLENKLAGYETFKNVFFKDYIRIAYGIAPCESVTRNRRWVQNDYEHLRPNKEKLKARKEAEKEYRKQARKKK